MNYVGVDVSKESFDAYSIELGSKKFSNNATGYKSFKNWIGSDSIHVSMEASGPYYLKLAYDLYNSSIEISVVNPLVIRRFCQMNLQRAKTDRKDATSIAQFAQMTTPKPWSPDPDHLAQLLQMQSVMEQLSKQLTSTNNALEAIHQYPNISKNALQSLNEVARLQKKQILQLEKQIMDLTKEHYQSTLDSLVSIPGIGKKTAMLLILSTNGFARFENIKQLVAYTGIAPRIFQSGKTINKKPKISKMGMADLRRSLFMCSLQAMKCNDACKNLYDRLRQKGKPAKVALMAISHKLLRQAFALAKKKTMYKTEFSFA